MSHKPRGFDIGQRRREYAQALEESLRRAIEVLSGIPEVERVILFGSYARGRRDLLTDLDLLVVMRTGLPFLERQKFLYSLLPLGVDADILCYTPEEVEGAKDRPFFRRILQEGIVVYEKKPS